MIMTLNKKFRNPKVKHNSVQSTLIRMGGVARLYSECLPYLMAVLLGDEDSGREFNNEDDPTAIKIPQAPCLSIGVSSRANH